MALAEHIRWSWGLLKSCGEETKVVEDRTSMKIANGVQSKRGPESV